MTEPELVDVLREEAVIKTTPLVQSRRPNQEIAYEIGVAIQRAIQQLVRMGYMPLGFREPRDILVDYDRMEPYPKFAVTLRF